jgi:hypothetical protein
MNPRVLLGALALAATVATLSLVEVRDEQPLAVDEKCDTYARLARQPDGGRGYVCGVTVDAGVDCSQTQAPELCRTWPVYEYRRISQSTHVRAPKGQRDGGCLIREPMPGLSGTFKTPRYFGEGNRFPRAWAVGPGCEEVAGQVESREEGEVDEAVLLSRTRDAGTDAGTVTRTR